MPYEGGTDCIATPGFAGFVPSLKYQFGLTYGNATRHILRTDPSLKQGIMQQEIATRKQTANASHVAQVAAEAASDVVANMAAGTGRGTTIDVKEVIPGKAFARKGAAAKGECPAGDESHDWVWMEGRKYATGDDRFSFPPVPGYTGFIPRSKEHFGRSYVETTNASLDDFQTMLKSKNQLPDRVRKIKEAYKTRTNTLSPSSSSSSPYQPHPPSYAPHPSTSTTTRTRPKKGPVGGGFAAGNASGAALGSSEGGMQAWKGSNTNIPTFMYSAESSPIDDVSPYHLPEGHPEKTFISGYTGFVPRHRNYFGEPYQDSVREALDEFTAPKAIKDPYLDPHAYDKVEKKNIVHTDPIPGFTGFIPGSRTLYSTTFGRTFNVAYDNFNRRDEKGHYETTLEPTERKNLNKTLPVPGYKGHIPKFIFSAERPYGISSKECIQSFKRERYLDDLDRARRGVGAAVGPSVSGIPLAV